MAPPAFFSKLVYGFFESEMELFKAWRWNLGLEAGVVHLF